MPKMNRYRVNYTSKSAGRVSRVVIAQTAESARNKIARNFGGKNIQVNKLG